MEAANNAGNVRRLFQLIRATGPQKSSVSETIKDKLGTIITNKEERLDRWAEYFEEQFNWSPSTGSLDLQTMAEPWAVNLDPPSLSEIRECISSLKRHRAPGPDNLPPALFKDGGDPLIRCIFHLLTRIWDTETVPDNWGESIIVPIFKKGARNECGNHRGISLTPVVMRLLASLILHRLSVCASLPYENNKRGSGQEEDASITYLLCIRCYSNAMSIGDSQRCIRLSTSICTSEQTCATMYALEVFEHNTFPLLTNTGSSPRAFLQAVVSVNDALCRHFCSTSLLMQS